MASWGDGYAAVRPAGGLFGRAQRIERGCWEPGIDPAAIDSAGDAVVMWERGAGCDSGTPLTVFASYMPAGGRFQAETVAHMGGWSGIAAVVMDPANEPTVALLGRLDSPAVNEGLSALTRSADGTWGSPQSIFDTDGSPNPPLSDDAGTAASLAYDSSGNLYAAWNAGVWNDSNETANTGIFSEVQPTGGSFNGQPVTVQQTDGAADGDGAPMVVGTGDGSALAIWATADGGEFSTYSASESGSGGGVHTR